MREIINPIIMALARNVGYKIGMFAVKNNLTEVIGKFVEGEPEKPMAIIGFKYDEYIH